MDKNAIKKICNLGAERTDLPRGAESPAVRHYGNGNGGRRC